MVLKINIKFVGNIDDTQDITTKTFGYSDWGIILMYLRDKNDVKILDLKCKIENYYFYRFFDNMYKFAYEKLRKEKSLGREINNIIFISDEGEFVVTGDENTDIPEGLEDWFKKQREKEKREAMEAKVDLE